MPVSNLLNIDPDKLFEECTVAEIEDVQTKLQNEIERKREELRTMVGERYRDLIEAADTISQMKMLSEKIIEDVNRMKVATAKLQDQHVSGFKIEYLPKEVRRAGPWTSVAAQIKMLVDVPEFIWEAVDRADFTRAALLFLMARYIKTSLEINPSFKTAEYFPVVLRHWSSILHFKDTILKQAEDVLKSQNNYEVTCNGLVSVVLLGGLSSSALLQHYLSLRSEALSAQLSSSQSLSGDVVQSRLRQSYCLLLTTITAIAHCFSETEEQRGLLWALVEGSVGPQSSPTVSLLEDAADIPTTLLPSTIRDFRPKLEQPLEPLTEVQLREALSAWLVWVRQCIRERGGQLLQRLSSLRSLQGLRDAPSVECEEWPVVGQRLLQLPSTDLWSELYLPLITARAQQLVSVLWDSAFKQLQNQIRAAVQAASTETKHTEVDLLWYMWKESASDLNHLSDNKTNKGLWLKSRGLTVRVAELCEGLEDKVSSLLDDLSFLCPQQEVDPTLLAISNTLKTHQQTVCHNLIERLTQFVGELLSEASTESAAMLLAKFLQSIPELCPSLSKSLSSMDSKGGGWWQESVALLHTQCQAAYQGWLRLATPRITSTVCDSLGSPLPDLLSIPQWEEITIEEEGEAGEKLQSVLKVPCNVSLNLQRALHSLASIIGRTAIPRQISDQLVDCVLVSVVQMYSSSVDHSLTQTQHLQTLMDVKYLLHLFNTSTNKELNTLCQSTVSKLESKIDPFDLNVFVPYINDNVKLTVHRTQALLGTGGSGVELAAPSHHSEECSVLPLSSSVTTWFPLLHITTPSRQPYPQPKPKGKKTNTTTSTSTSAETGLKTSGATSFFGSMATDWFG